VKRLAFLNLLLAASHEQRLRTPAEAEGPRRRFLWRESSACSWSLTSLPARPGCAAELRRPPQSTTASGWASATCSVAPRVRERRAGSLRLHLTDESAGDAADFSHSRHDAAAHLKDDGHPIIRQVHSHAPEAPRVPSSTFCGLWSGACSPAMDV
jgi:hypothetical protein